MKCRSCGDGVDGNVGLIIHIFMLGCYDENLYGKWIPRKTRQLWARR